MITINCYQFLVTLSGVDLTWENIVVLITRIRGQRSHGVNNSMHDCVKIFGSNQVCFYYARLQDKLKKKNYCDVYYRDGVYNNM